MRDKSSFYWKTTEVGFTSAELLHRTRLKAAREMRRIFQIGMLGVLLSVSAAAQRTSVSVENGSGDGLYRGNGSAHVWADPHPPGTVFDRWTGDTSLLENPFEYHSRVNRLSRKINLTANYKAAPVWNPAFETINGSSMGFYFPPAPVGVIFHFHGAGGGANGLFNSAEQRVFADDAVAEGYGIVALSSADRASRQWNPSSQLENNPDMQNVRAAVNLFVSRGLITSRTPLFASGISNGGAFAPRVSLALGFRATGIFVAAGTANILTQTSVPTLWNVARNDTIIGADGIAQAFSNYRNLLARGVPAQYNVLDASPVFPERFRRVGGLTAADSRAIYDALKQNAFLDARDYLIENPNVSNWASVVPARYSASLNEIGNQLAICYAEHSFFSDYNRRVLNFFGARISN